MAIEKKGALGNLVKSVRTKAKKSAEESKAAGGKEAPQPVAQSPRTAAAPAPELTKTKTVAALDRDPDSLPSDPVGSRAITTAQSETAELLTRGTVPFRVDAAEPERELPGGVQRLADNENPRPDKTDHLVSDPIEEEQRSDLEFTGEFEPGSEVPDTPDLSEQEPDSSETLVNGTTVESYTGEDGVVYQRQVQTDGTVRTTYEVDGVRYTDTTHEDGSRQVFLSQDDEEALFSRTVEFDADGTVRSDGAHVTQASYDGETREAGIQSKEVRIDESGVVTTTERVRRPDGGESNFERVEQPSGQAEEIYTYEGEQGTVQRTTTQAPDGSGETRTEKAYTVDQPIEELVDGPPVPGRLEERVVELPQNDREDTQVHEVEVTTTNASGDTSLQYEETTYSQTSGDVTPSEHAFSEPIEANPEGSSITHTYTTVTARDEEGNLQTSSGGSQSFTLAGTREGEDLSVTRTDTWNGAGETTEAFTQDGFTNGDLLTTSRANDFYVNEFSGSAGGQYIHATIPDVGKSPFDHLNQKGGGAWDFIGEDYDQELNVTASVSRDANGDVIQENLNYASLDEDGNGRTVTRSETENGVAWNYTNYENDGQDYQRQTVIEGTDISVYETHEVTGSGEFVTTSETTDDGVPIASSQASRERLSEDELRQQLENGALSQAEFQRMLQDGPPYYAEQFTEHAEALLDGDEPRRDDEGNVIQGGHDATSLTLSSGDGYSVSRQYRQEFNDGENWTSSEIRTVTDHDSDMPIESTITHRARDPQTGQFNETDSGVLEVYEDGRVNLDGQQVGEFELGGASIQDLMQGPNSINSDQIVGTIGGAAMTGENYYMLPGNSNGRFVPSRGLGVIGRSTEIFGVFTGAGGVFRGVSEGNPRAVVEGIGGIAGGVNSLAAATSFLARGSRFAPAASRAAAVTAGTTTIGRALGAVGGVIGFGFGVYDILNAEDGWGRAAGALNATAGAVAFGSAFFGPPGWIAGGLIAGSLSIAAVFVGNGGQNDTVSVDERFNTP